MVRIEDYIDMMEYEGLHVKWLKSEWPRSQAFSQEFPRALWAAFVSKSLVMPLNRVCFGLEAALVSDALKPNHIELIKRSFKPVVLPHAFGRLPSSTVVLTLNELFKRALVCKTRINSGPLTTSDMIKFFVAGSLSGVITTSIFHPQDVARVCFNIDFARRRNYDGILHAVESQYISGGYKHLWKGFVPALLGSALYRGSFFGLFEVGNLALISPSEQGAFQKVCGLAVGVSLAASIIAYPFDRIRKTIILQLMSREPGVYVRTTAECVAYLRKLGATQFLQGLPVCALKSLGGAALLIAFYGKRRLHEETL